MPPRGYAIKRARFMREMKKAGIANGNQLALRLGMNRSTIGEVLSGKALAGVAFAASACQVFDCENTDIFVVPATPKVISKVPLKVPPKVKTAA